MTSADDAPPGCPFQRASNLAAEIIRRNYQPTRPDGSRPRGVHDKTHACLRAEFRVLPPADPRLQHGLFAAEARHPALIRFSSSTFQTDWQPDLRGLAIKLHGVTGDCFEDGPAGQQVAGVAPAEPQLRQALQGDREQDQADQAHAASITWKAAVKPGPSADIR